MEGHWQCNHCRKQDLDCVVVGKAERCSACTSGWCSLKQTTDDARVLAAAGQTLSFLKGMVTNICCLDQS